MTQFLDPFDGLMSLGDDYERQVERLGDDPTSTPAANQLARRWFPSAAFVNRAIAAQSQSSPAASMDDTQKQRWLKRLKRLARKRQMRRMRGRR